LKQTDLDRVSQRTSAGTSKGRKAGIFLALALTGALAVVAGVVSGANGVASSGSRSAHAAAKPCHFLSIPKAHSENDPLSGHSLWAQRMDATDNVDNSDQTNNLNNLNNLDKRLPGDFDGDPGANRWMRSPLPSQVYGRINLEQIVVLSAIFLVLLIGCANLGGQMVRETARWRVPGERTHEAREQVLWRSLSESLVLAMAGGTVGLAIASFSGSSFWPTQYLFSDALYPSPRLRVVILTLAVCVIAGVVFGIVPAIRMSRKKMLAPRAMRVRFALSNNYFARRAVIATELILMLVLLAGTGFLLGRSLHTPVAPMRTIPGRITV
jgi:hypothetical protein